MGEEGEEGFEEEGDGGHAGEIYKPKHDESRAGEFAVDVEGESNIEEGVEKLLGWEHYEELMVNVKMLESGVGKECTHRDEEVGEEG